MHCLLIKTHPQRLKPIDFDGKHATRTIKNITSAIFCRLVDSESESDVVDDRACASKPNSAEQLFELHSKLNSTTTNI